MSVYDDTDEAYGTGKCCWCGTRQSTYYTCSHGPYDHNKKCANCKKDAYTLLNNLCSGCYHKN